MSKKRKSQVVEDKCPHFYVFFDEKKADAWVRVGKPTPNHHVADMLPLCPACGERLVP